jgi:hypothetical protein
MRDITDRNKDQICLSYDKLAQGNCDDANFTLVDEGQRFDQMLRLLVSYDELTFKPKGLSVHYQSMHFFSLPEIPYLITES